jgi:hypothetical protein
VTRQEYLDSANQAGAHRQYYSQYVDTAVLMLIEKQFELLLLQSSKDEHFNDIPLRRWDVLVPYIKHSTRQKLITNGDSITLGTGVCILKEAARQLVENAR